MKKLAVLLLCILPLCACSVKQKPPVECVNDTIPDTASCAYTMEVKIPDDAVLLTQEEGFSLYDQGNYQIIKETFSAASAQQGMEQMTGFSAASLQPIHLSDFSKDKYYFSWSGVGEEGCECCYGVLLYDGETCYTVQIRCPESAARTYEPTFISILLDAGLTPI